MSMATGFFCFIMVFAYHDPIYQYTRLISYRLIFTSPNICNPFLLQPLLNLCICFFNAVCVLIVFLSDRGLSLYDNIVMLDKNIINIFTIEIYSLRIVIHSPNHTTCKIKHICAFTAVRRLVGIDMLTKVFVLFCFCHSCNFDGSTDKSNQYGGL